MLTENHPTLKPYDQDVWAALPDASSADWRVSLALLRGLHGRWTAFWESLPEDAWGRTAYHPENGTVTLADQLRIYAAHGQGHIWQIGHTLAAQEDTGENLNKTRLLVMIQAERTYLAHLLADLNEAQMVAAGVEGDWSVKDIVAHVSAWERLMIEWLDDAVRGVTLDRPRSNEDIDRLNASMFAAARERPLAVVLAEFEAGADLVETAVLAVPDDELFAPQHPAWSAERPLWYMIGADTYWHYREHMHAIQDWLEKN